MKAHGTAEQAAAIARVVQLLRQIGAEEIERLADRIAEILERREQDTPRPGLRVREPCRA